MKHDGSHYDSSDPDSVLGRPEISYCDLVRIMFPNGWHYYINVVMTGTAPRKFEPAKNSSAGIDPGISTMAVVTEREVFLKELAPDVKKYNKEITALQQKLDRSRRLSNPGKYNPDGTINKNCHDRWVFTKNVSPVEGLPEIYIW